MPKPFEDPPIPIDKIPVDLLPDDKFPENVTDKIPVLPDDTADIDALIANSVQPNQLLTNDGSGTFVASNLDGGIHLSRGIALGDVDGNGSAPAVDAYGFPNINLDGLLPEPPTPDVVV